MLHSCKNRTNMCGILIAAMSLWAGCQPVREDAPKELPSRWWKGNWHTHSQWSDGKAFPETVVKWYKDHGYHFLGMSDHRTTGQGELWKDVLDRRSKGKAFDTYMETFGWDWVELPEIEGTLQVRCKPLYEYREQFEQPGKFLLLEAEEISMEGRVHINAINIVDRIPEIPFETVHEKLCYALTELAEQSRQRGRFMAAQINHPNWCWTLTAEDIAPVEGALFLEIYNYDAASNNCFGDSLHASTERIWDIVLTQRLAEMNLPIIYGTADDDAHNFLEFGKDNSNPGRGWVMVRSKYLTPEGILRAMEKGDFYFSSGVTLNDIQFDGKTMSVKVRPERGVQYAIEFIGTRKGYDPSSRPVLDEKGQEIRTTRIYSDQIGQTFAKHTGTLASYTLRGDEIYVRAKISSTKPKANSVLEEEFEAAWTQPVVPIAPTDRP